MSFIYGLLGIIIGIIVLLVILYIFVVMKYKKNSLKKEYIDYKDENNDEFNNTIGRNC